jgi:hypothetical protein
MIPEEELVSEAEVVQGIEEFFNKQGYKTEEKHLKGKGIDLRLSKNGVQHIFEMEGNKNPSPEEAHYPTWRNKPRNRNFSTSQKYTHYYRSIAQICARMKNNKGKFYIGLPKGDKYYEKKVDETSEGLKRLGITIVWYDKKSKTVTMEEFRGNDRLRQYIPR